MSSLIRTTFGLCLAGCVAAPLVARLSQRLPATDAGHAPVIAGPVSSSPAPPVTGVELEAGRDGHYRAEVRIDGFSVPVLVDTGATLLSLSAQDARRIGLNLTDADYKYQTATANGFARVALTTLHEVQLGSIRLYDVQASVAQGEGLSTSLLGMSFLGRLAKVEVSGRRLVVRQ